MHVSDLLVEGVSLMLLGMGGVFLFLTILVLAMSGVSRLVAPFSDEIIQPDLRQQPTSAVTGKEHEEIIAVISAAVSRYRNKS